MNSFNSKTIFKNLYELQCEDNFQKFYNANERTKLEKIKER
jgi:hypothetical protein